MENKPTSYKYSSPDVPGLHTVISPDNSACKLTWIFRLNLVAGMDFELAHELLELNAVVITGKVNVMHRNVIDNSLASKDSFYLPAGEKVTIHAVTDSFLYIGGGPYEGIGEFFIRRYDLELPLKDIHQVHGEPPYQRDVFMTINQEVPASRIIAGVTFGDPGGWTSWPPHQHSLDLEEVYCYFDIPHPSFALHLVWKEPGKVDKIYPVSTGDCVIIPEGYHPTVAIPGVRSSYFWLMVAHSHKQRHYDLAVNDPNFDTKPTFVKAKH